MVTILKIKKSNKKLKDKSDKRLSKDKKPEDIDKEAISDNEETASDSSVKTYKLTDEAISFARGPIFRFRIAFSVLLETGETAIRPQKKCPVIEIAKDSVIQTSNIMAQISIENFILPSRTTRNGDGVQGGDGNAFAELLINDPNMRVIDLDALYFK